MLGAPADLLSLLYIALALFTLWQIPGRWRSLADATYTADDHNLASRIGFLLLTPLGVLLHELAHSIQTVGEEHQADCYARDHLRRVLKRFWRFKPDRINTEYQEALAAEREGAREDARYGCVR